MKQFSLLLLVLVMLSSCNTGKSKGQHASCDQTMGDGVEVLYFYGKQRCLTCNTIERETIDLLDNRFKQAMQEGKVVYKGVDISTKEGELLADRYEVTWSSLYVVCWNDGKEEAQNLTDFAFSYARKDSAYFKAHLAEVINSCLPQ